MTDLSPWGWAPGDYLFKCVDCPPAPSHQRLLDGNFAAKRAWRCKEHAEAAKLATEEHDKIEHQAQLQRAEARDHDERVTELIGAATREVNYRRLLKRLLRRADAVITEMRTYIATNGTSGWESFVAAQVNYDVMNARMPADANDPAIPALLEEFR